MDRNGTSNLDNDGYASEGPFQLKMTTRFRQHTIHYVQPRRIYKMWGLFSIQIWGRGPSSFLCFTFCCLEACSFTSDAMDSACTETGQKNEKN